MHSPPFRPASSERRHRKTDSAAANWTDLYHAKRQTTRKPPLGAEPNRLVISFKPLILKSPAEPASGSSVPPIWPHSTAVTRAMRLPQLDLRYRLPALAVWALLCIVGASAIAETPAGEKIYREQCARCHGKSG